MANAALISANKERPNHPLNAVCESEICFAEERYEDRNKILEELLHNNRYRHYASALLAPIYLEQGKITSLSIIRNLYDPNVTIIYCGLPREHHAYFAAGLAFSSALISEYQKTWANKHIFEAAELLKNLSTFRQTSAVFFQCVGDCLFALKRYGEARQCYDRSLEIEKHPAPLCGLGLFEFVESNFEKARELAHEALSIDAEFFAARYVHALVNIESKNYQDGIEELEELLSMQPTHLSLMEKLGSALIASNFDRERGESLLVFTRQRHSGVGSRNEELVRAAIGILGKLAPG